MVAKHHKLIQSLELSLETTYVPGWGLVEGLREAVQNALDSEDEGYPMSVTHERGVLSILNAGASMERDVLLLGRTSKRGTGQRGQFGEGLKIGCLGLARAGFEVEVDTGIEILAPVIRRSAAFPNRDTLWFDVFERDPRAPVQVEFRLRPLPVKIWASAKKRFLRLSPPEKVVVTSPGRILLDRPLRGQVFVRGIFIQHRPDLKLGYDLEQATIDRDRNMIEGYALSSTLAKMHAEGTMLAPQAMGSLTYSLLLEEAADVGHFHYGHGEAYERATRHLRGLFLGDHGDKAVPVRSIEESRKLSRFGRRGVVLPHGLFETLAPSFDAVRRRLDDKAQVAARYGWGDLREREQKVLEQASALLQGADSAFNLDRVQVVKLRSLTEVPVLGMHDPDTKQIEIDRSRLRSTGDCLSTLLHEFAHDYGDDLTPDHVGRMEYLYQQVVEQLLPRRG